MAEKMETVETPAEDVIVIPLRKPINSFGEEVKELKCRRPIGAELVRIGNPVIFDPISDPPQIRHDYSKVVQWLVALSGVPSSSITQLPPSDLTKAAWDITPFFLPTTGT